MSKNYQENFKLWCNRADKQTKAELMAICEDEKEIEDRFYKDLAFGTAGLRGILGAGSNRMNFYTVRRATYGLACYLSEMGDEAKKRGVAISYDCRHYSKEFALEAACVLAAAGIHAYIYPEMQPTPALSFAVRYLKTVSGIMITASHNPANYNGYKVYGEDGAQLSVQASGKVLSFINQTDLFSVPVMDAALAQKRGLLTYMDEEVYAAYIEAVKGCLQDTKATKEKTGKLTVVYTPFHGAGYKPVMRALKQAGFTRVYPVNEQTIPDPDFSTVKSPNPENPEGFSMAISLAQEKQADIIIGTDPDSDRIGVLCKTENGYTVLNGNQTGVLLIDYVLSHKKDLLPQDYVVSTIVSTNMVENIAKAYGVKLYQVYTGFKFIAGVIRDHEENPDGGRYLFGFEESFGYLPGTYARDKDAVGAALLICEMAAFYKEKNMTLIMALENLGEKYGYFAEHTESVYMDGIDGMERMQALLASICENPFHTIGNEPVLAFRNYNINTRYDYVTGKEEPLNMEPANVLYFELADQGFVIFRPSGTEPKIKIYFSVSAPSVKESQAKLNALKIAIQKILA